MKLTDRIRRDHSRKKTKLPRLQTAYAAVAAITNKYGLSEHFAEKLGNVPEVPHGAGFTAGPIKEKPGLDAAPFILSDPRQYYAVRHIEKAAENPYLAYAKSPEEIMLSIYLFAINPRIRPELLRSRHFEVLILAEAAKNRLKAVSALIEKLLPVENLPAKASGKRRLSGKMKEGPRKGKRNTAARSEEPERSSIGALKSRMEALQEFIDFVEKTNGSETGKWPEE